ncbi:MAG: hypothetical protein DRQ51_08705 [Gammaproteobacteria bacterium]|nr:MAG: hypothetical protein DRQ51_08705 [Gammaproteobacteria bacterium]
MIYFDTDVWIHSLICQDEGKHKQACKIINTHKDGFIISTLNLQEIIFVLGKLEVDKTIANKILNYLFKLEVIEHSAKDVKDAWDLVQHMKFVNINDCLHTIIAMRHCGSLTTYNKKDFKKIAKLTDLKITIL